MFRKLVKAVLPKPARLALRRAFGRIESGECGRYKFAHGRMTVNRVAIANHLASLYGFDSYLEIGVRNRQDMFNHILCGTKAGVDPDPNAQADFVMTSDAFFEAHPDKTFDLVFIDGDHTGAQVEKDIANSLNALKPGGIILLHDLNPPTAFHARENFIIDDGIPPDWNGTSWEGYMVFRKTRPDLEMYVIDTDWGVGFVRHGKQHVYEGPAETYEDLEANRIEMLNLISVRDFLRRHPSQ